MSKILLFMTFIIFSQSAYANDFLLPGKQLLICEKEEVLFRINWEDWDVENKSFAIRTKNKLKNFKLSTNREGPEILYVLRSQVILYENGDVTSDQTSLRIVGPDMELMQHMDLDSFNYHYVDKAASDAQVKKICKD